MTTITLPRELVERAIRWMEAAEVRIEWEFGCSRGLAEIEADGDLSPEISDLRSAIALALHDPEVDARIAAAEAERDSLRAAITAHNDGCEMVCADNRKSGRCDAYIMRNRYCTDCPRDDMIDVAALAAKEPRNG